MGQRNKPDGDAPNIPNMPEPLRLGEWVRQARKAVPLTQEELAERAGLSVYTISNIERGIPHAPRPDTVQLLIRALDAAPEDTVRLLQSARSMPDKIGRASCRERV